MTKKELIAEILKDKRTAELLVENDLKREKKAFLENMLENIQDEQGDGSKRALAKRISENRTHCYAGDLMHGFRKDALLEMSRQMGLD